MADVTLPSKESTLFDAIAHGDEAHRAWLKQAIDDHFAGRPVQPMRGLGRRESIATQVVQNVCELPDYNSPDDQPDLVMCTVQELENCVLRAFEAHDNETGARQSIELLPAEKIALTVSLAQILRGEGQNTGALCVLALARLDGRYDWTKNQPEVTVTIETETPSLKAGGGA